MGNKRIRLALFYNEANQARHIFFNEADSTRSEAPGVCYIRYLSSGTRFGNSFFFKNAVQNGTRKKYHNYIAEPHKQQENCCQGSVQVRGMVEQRNED